MQTAQQCRCWMLPVANMGAANVLWVVWDENDMKWMCEHGNGLPRIIRITAYADGPAVPLLNDTCCKHGRGECLMSENDMKWMCERGKWVTSDDSNNCLCRRLNSTVVECYLLHTWARRIFDECNAIWIIQPWRHTHFIWMISNKWGAIIRHTCLRRRRSIFRITN
jgi:hypothetical protein